MNPGDLERALHLPGPIGSRLEDVVAELAQRVARLEDLLHPHDPADVRQDPRLPELELQHRGFVARIREHEEG